MTEVISLLGGLALFLYGLQLMTEKLERATGAGLAKLLPAMTKNRVTGWLAATAATGVMQSSSRMTAWTVGMAEAGIVSLACAAGVIMGANIGSTATAFLLSVNANAGAWLAAAGLLIALVFRRDRAKQTGYLLLSVGVVFAGMHLMTSAMAALKGWKGMTYLMLGIEQPLLAVLLGAGVAAILQSSAATVGILQAMAVQGLLPMQTAFYIVAGANIGTCVTAVIASSGAGLRGRRAAAMHLLFNLICTAAFFAAARYLPLTEYALLAGSNVRLQIACLHLAFNLAPALVLLPFAGLVCALARLFVRGKQEEKPQRYYDERMLAVPSFALVQLDKETKRLCGMNRQQLQQAADAWQGAAADGEEAAAVCCGETAQAVRDGLLCVRGSIHAERDAARMKALLQAVSQAQGLGRCAQRLHELRKQHTDTVFDEESMDELTLMTNKALNMADMAMQALFDGKMSGEKKQSMQLMARDTQECAEEMLVHLSGRLASGVCSAENGMVYQALLHEITQAAAYAGAMAQG